MWIPAFPTALLQLLCDLECPWWMEPLGK
jgi:hypothetical protein